MFENDDQILSDEYLDDDEFLTDNIGIYLINTNQNYLTYSNREPTEFYLVKRACSYLHRNGSEKRCSVKISLEYFIPDTYEAFILYIVFLDYDPMKELLTGFVKNQLDRFDDTFKSKFQIERVKFEQLDDNHFVGVVLANIRNSKVAYPRSWSDEYDSVR